MMLIVMFLVVLAMLWVTKCLEARLGEAEEFEQLITAPRENRGRFTAAGWRANK